ncbi:MAG: 4-(cytidine 5'-diphospho)-2-C-methyl-D-erythritol kinase [Chitinophagaceae bacterium]|nr:4-(cytidine 5'-diphospho)-2-C-methyl-D-erythritol kinase [Chitinophagaceae bacterium]
MLVFPNCKINLGLQILHKRTDGFHDLETVFYPLAFRDALELIPNTNNETGVTFTGTGLAVEGKTEDNLCIKAYQLLKKDFSELPSVSMHLHKAIPMGAGLGGGSAAAAFTLKLLNDKFKLNISTPQLLNYAKQLGSDCPFFIINKPCFATGRGEILEELVLDLSHYKIVLINPGIHINTGWAFTELAKGSNGSRLLDPYIPSLKTIMQQPIDTWKSQLTNDFETVVFMAHPEIKSIKENLYKLGAIYAAMSGSGSTVFGIFSNDIDPNLFRNDNYFIKSVN